MKSQLKGGNFSEGARCAERARTAPANTLKNPPPPGPKPEPVRINGVPKVGGNGIK
ncbi:hypothetical protein ACLQ8Z_22995 [Bordetella hinzii]|uniref:Uncharacterized protein n=1 Tax=Bordetella hinzii OH87 BAL007II TaxID=1331262 RepID=A0ABR4R5D9_9BORD|nr:hypothetical protein [Bordetella hinzii]KCB26145.1 hypothetical protein L544_3243 [Bordetella hinzii OH87 BAL007II]